jgi:hypothetical protein
MARRADDELSLEKHVLVSMPAALVRLRHEETDRRAAQLGTLLAHCRERHGR